MGGIITDINAKEGQWVNKGSSIIKLDSEIMKSNVEELVTALEFAETTFERQKVLWDKKIGSEIQFLQIKNQYESLQNKLETAENQLKKLTIKAPINGIIEEIFLNEEYFLTLLQVHYVTFVCFCVCSQPIFFSSFIKEVTLNY